MWRRVWKHLKSGIAAAWIFLGTLSLLLMVALWVRGYWHAVDVSAWVRTSPDQGITLWLRSASGQGAFDVKRVHLRTMTSARIRLSEETDAPTPANLFQTVSILPEQVSRAGFGWVHRDAPEPQWCVAFPMWLTLMAVAAFVAVPIVRRMRRRRHSERCVETPPLPKRLRQFAWRVIARVSITLLAAFMCLWIASYYSTIKLTLHCARPMRSAAPWDQSIQGTFMQGIALGQIQWSRGTTEGRDAIECECHFGGPRSQLKGWSAVVVGLRGFSGSHQGSPQLSVTRWQSPVWLYIVLLASPWVVRVVFRRFHPEFPVGCCQNCGYDLRASKERCPECGTAIPVEPGGVETSTRPHPALSQRERE